MEWPEYKRRGWVIGATVSYPDMIQYALRCREHGDKVVAYDSTGNPCLFSLVPECAPASIILTRRVHDGCHQKVEEKEVWEKVMPESTDCVSVDINVPENKRVSITLTDEQMKQLRDTGWRNIHGS